MLTLLMASPMDPPDPEESRPPRHPWFRSRHGVPDTAGTQTRWSPAVRNQSPWALAQPWPEPLPQAGTRFRCPSPGGDGLVPEPVAEQDEAEASDPSPHANTAARNEILYVSPSGSPRSTGLSAASRPSSLSAALLRAANSQSGTTELVLMPGSYPMPSVSAGSPALTSPGRLKLAPPPFRAGSGRRWTSPSAKTSFSPVWNFRDSRAGVAVTNSARVVILDNAIHDTGGAIVISGSKGVQVDRNLITRTGIGRQSGAAINVFDSIATVIHGNHLERSDVAAIFTRSAATVSDNTLIAIAAPSGAAVTSTADGSLMFGNIVWHTSTGAAISIPNGDGVTGNIAISFSQQAVEHASGTVLRNLLLSEGPAVDGNLGHEVLEAEAFDQGFFADEVLSAATLRLLELLDNPELQLQDVLPILDSEYSAGALAEETPLDLIEEILAQRDRESRNGEDAGDATTDETEDAPLQDPLRPGPNGPIGARPTGRYRGPQRN